MSTLRSKRLAALLGASFISALSMTAYAQTADCPPPGLAAPVDIVAPVIQTETAPPPLPDYDQPPIPGPDYVWTPGYWGWNGYDHFWVPGTWVEPPQPDLLWTPGYWGLVGALYVFRPGYWGHDVGYYGGIDYGHGYDGRGYEGGRWQGGHFFYNRAVNNVGSARIANVYTKDVPPNNGPGGRASFSGPGGASAAPTPEQIAAAKDKHVALTQQQVAHVRAASTNPTAFATVNKGAPTVAATVKPGVLTGPGVVRALPPSAAAKVTPVPIATPTLAPAPLKPASALAPSAVTPTPAQPLKHVMTPQPGTPTPAAMPLKPAQPQVFKQAAPPPPPQVIRQPPPVMRQAPSPVFHQAAPPPPPQIMRQPAPQITRQPPPANNPRPQGNAHKCPPNDTTCK